MVNKFNFLQGGADKYFLDLSALLNAHGFDVAHFCMHHPSNLPDRCSTYFVSHLNFNKFSWKSAWKYLGRMFYSLEVKRKFSQLVFEFQPDVIHLHNIYHQISPSILDIAREKKIPVVMHLHDYKLVCGNYKMFHHGNICEACKGGRHWRCITHRCFKNSILKSLIVAFEMYLHHRVLNIYDRNIAYYIAPSEFMRKKMIEWGIDQKKIKMVHHFMETRDLAPEYRVGEYFLYFGRLSEEKGIDQLLGAVNLVPNAKLKLVGAGSMSSFVKTEIARLNLSQRVELIGPKYAEELKNMIRQSLAVVVPSRWYEVFGLVSMEASALGKAVLAADIGGIPEVVKDQRTGLLFNPFVKEDLAEKMQWMLDHRDVLPGFGRAGRRFVEEAFNPEKHFNQINDLYKQVIKKNR